MHLIISCSLNINSRSRKLAEIASSYYSDAGVNLIDLSKIELPFCDGDLCYDNDEVDKLKNLISSAHSIIVAGPIYNYDLNAAAKNLIELTGRSWTDKIVGFICAAGGKGSYMSPMYFMNSLVLDFRCIIVPRFVYADKSYFSETNDVSEVIKDRIKKLVDKTVLFSTSLIDN